MQNKYGKEGLVSLSVNLDKSDEKEAQQKSREFLQDRKVTLINLFLDEDIEFWSKKLHFEAVPCVYVFNRQGKWVMFNAEIDYDKIEEQVVKFLKEK
jgi:hypothetical protein